MNGVLRLASRLRSLTNKPGLWVSAPEKREEKFHLKDL